MKGLHFSSLKIRIGDVITSEQSKSRSIYDIVHPVYKRVADELGLYFPNEFGYAYPEGTHLDFEHAYLVEAPDEKVTRGNFNYSLYVAMSEAMRTDRNLPLQERLAQRAITIENWARAYFTELQNPRSIELISDSWIVKRKVR